MLDLKKYEKCMPYRFRVESTEEGQMFVYRRKSKKSGTRIYRFRQDKWLPRRLRHQLKKIIEAYHESTNTPRP